MSLGGPREEKDKSGSSCTACDVAINTVWFEDVMYDSIAFTTFVVNIAMEGTTRNLFFLIKHKCFDCGLLNYIL